MPNVRPSSPGMSVPVPAWRRSFTLVTSGLALCTMVAAGCTARAKTVTDTEALPLSMPAPPPRVLAQVEEEPLVATTPTTPDQVAQPATLPPPSTQPPRPRQERGEARPEPPAAAVSTPPAGAPPERALRITNSQSESQQQKLIEQLIVECRGLLGKLEKDKSRLSKGEREAFENATARVALAERNLKERKLDPAEAAVRQALGLAQGLR